MTLYEEHLQYARDIVRIRDAIFSNNMSDNIGSLYVKDEQFFIDVYHDDCEKPICGLERVYSNSAYTFISSQSMSICTSAAQVIDSSSKLEVRRWNVDLEYSEDKHFQDMLLYPTQNVLNRTVVNYFITKSIPDFNVFRIKHEYIPILLSILDNLNDTI